MKLTVRDTAILAMLGTILYCSKLVTELLPNVHLLGIFVVAFTVVYRKKALYPIYIFVLLTGLFNGFNVWWLPYLYIWAVLWGMVMLLPKSLPEKWAPIVYIAVCALHGYLYGTLYAPAQAILFGLDFEGMIAWIVAGLPWDMVHGTSNLVCGVLIWPLVQLLRKMERQSLT